MDEFTEKYLKQWGFENLVGRFKDIAKSKSYYNCIKKYRFIKIKILHELELINY